MRRKPSEKVEDCRIAGPRGNGAKPAKSGHTVTSASHGSIPEPPPILVGQRDLTKGKPHMIYYDLATMLEQSAAALRLAAARERELLGVISENVGAFRIDNVNFSVRTKGILASNGFRTILELAERTADDLLALPRFGVSAINEVREKLKRYGLCLKGDNQ